jgi:hypothetical protein
MPSISRKTGYDQLGSPDWQARGDVHRLPWRGPTLGGVFSERVISGGG